MADKKDTQDFEVTPVGVSPQNTQGRRQLTPEEIAEIKRRKEARLQNAENGSDKIRKTQGEQKTQRPALTDEEREEIRKRREARQRASEKTQNGFAVEETRKPVRQQEFTVEETRKPSRQQEFTVEETRKPVRQQGFTVEEARTPARQREQQNGFAVEETRKPSRQQEFTVEETRKPVRQQGVAIEETRTPARQREVQQGFAVEETRRPSRQQGVTVEEARTPARQREQQNGFAVEETRRPVRQSEHTLTDKEREEIRKRKEARQREQQNGFAVEETRKPVKQRENAVDRTGNKTENEARPRRRIQDESHNVYRYDREKEERERRRDDRERERNNRRKEIEAASKWFVPNTEKNNYFINLLFVTFKIFILCVLIIGISGIGFVFGMSKSYLETVPELDLGVVEQQDQATVLMDVNGEFLGNYYNMENREWATLEELPDNLENAVIAIEDVRFRRHLGVDFKRLFSVVIGNLTSGSMQGGSTITQQLIKNTILSFEQTYKRKIQEASLAFELERVYDKDTILEAYLNTIYMGGSCYGVKTAAMDYFGKELSELTLRECACLAGMIQNPSRYNPRSNYYSRNNPDRTDNRTNLVLYEMRDNGLISEEEYQAARKDSLTVNESSPFKNEAGMIYFTDYVIDSVVDSILEDRGMENTSANRSSVRNEIRTSGYKIYTTLDAKKQTEAENAVYNFKGYPKMRYESDSYTVTGRNPDGTVIRLTQPQAAVAVMDYHNGYIVALVGGRQAPTGSMQFNRAYQSTMPVGSSIKPIAVYAPAIEKGSGIGTVYYDYQMKIEGWVSENGYPANNSRTYSGRVNMRTAFVNSLNTSAAQALLYDVGLDDSYNTLVKLGVNPSHISKTGSGLALGSSGITPLEMAGAFSTIANLGTYIEPIAFTRVEDKNGNLIIDRVVKQEKHKVFSESTAWQVADMMRSVATSGIKNRVAVSGQTVYGKTGTNSESRGVFFAGFTGYYTCCVWVGSDAYKPLQSNAQGSAYAGPVFQAVMNKLHKGLPDKAFTDVSPESIGVQQVKYCTVSGLMASEECPSTHTEYGDPSKLITCTMHKRVEICTLTGLLATDSCPQESREAQTMVLIPERPLLKNMYLNYNERFVSVAGNATTNLKRCSGDHGQDAG